MGNIVLLDELTINKIAAGEVIERPASVIKEMVENSIDAGATSVSVEIKNGGISYIRIIDNGKGISPDDMEIAFERHATSKIRNAEDLAEVKSMGFRGEALASIAAVSNVEMISRTADNEIGNRIVVEAGNVIEQEEAGAPIGTCITVTNLFFNTPVRYKFLKKDFTESGYIEDAMTRLALVHPEIAFKLINTGKVILQTPGNGDIKTVIYNIYGKDVADGILETNYGYEDITITGVVGKPEIARSNRSNQLFFVNKRYIKDKTLAGAAEKAFKGMLPIGKYGFMILNLEMNPSKVDVNVHPAKLEVRFEEESKVFKALYHAIRETLLKNDLIADTEKEPEERKPFAIPASTIVAITNSKIENPVENKLGVEQKQETKSEEVIKNRDAQQKAENIILDLYKSKLRTENELGADKHEAERAEMGSNFERLLALQKQMQEQVDNAKKEMQGENVISNPIEQEDKQVEQEVAKEETVEANVIPNEQAENFEEMYSKVFGKQLVTEKKQETEENVIQANEILQMDEPVVENTSLFEKDEKYQAKRNYKFIGIAFSTYIIIQMENDLYIMDQHAAHERIMYEKVRENFYKEENKDSQLMILPDIITLTHKEMDIAKDNMALFEKAGFMLEEFGENTIKISGTPSICLELDTKELFLETLDEINTVARTAKQEIEEKFIATIACKAAVKANMALTKEEVDNLMEQLLKLPNPFTCPHGRPTVIKMTKQDIEKKFARRK